MFDDPDAGTLGIGGMFALYAQLGIIQRGVIGRSDAAQREQARIQAFLVHIRKHLLHADAASVFHFRFAHHPAVAVVVFTHGQRGGRRSVNAQLVLDAHGGDVIPGAQRAVLVHPELGHDEKRYARGAFFGARRLRQHQMDDVFGQVMVAR